MFANNPSPRKVGRDNNRLSLPECYGMEYLHERFLSVCKYACVHGASGSGGCKAMMDFIDGKFRQPKF